MLVCFPIYLRPTCLSPLFLLQVLVTDIPGMKHGTIIWYLRLVRLGGLQVLAYFASDAVLPLIQWMLASGKIQAHTSRLHQVVNPYRYSTALALCHVQLLHG
jgi:hypothetical protein